MARAFLIIDVVTAALYSDSGFRHKIRRADGLKYSPAIRSESYVLLQ
jgi:hypothetical protein